MNAVTVQEPPQADDETPLTPNPQDTSSPSVPSPEAPPTVDDDAAAPDSALSANGSVVGANNLSSDEDSNEQLDTEGLQVVQIDKIDTDRATSALLELEGSDRREGVTFAEVDDVSMGDATVIKLESTNEGDTQKEDVIEESGKSQAQHNSISGKNPIARTAQFGRKPNRARASSSAATRKASSASLVSISLQEVCLISSQSTNMIHQFFFENSFTASI
jgi:hypothetical protein